MPCFSIIIPVRDGGQYLEQSVQSVLAQEYGDFELCVLIHDSSDTSLDFLKSLKDKRVIIHEAKGIQGITGNWERIKGIRRNEFMTILGYDDILHPHYLSEMASLIDKHPNATLYQAHFNFIDSSGQHLRFCLPMDEIQYGHEFLACHMMQTMDSMGTGYCFRSADYDRLGGIPCDYPNLIFADYALWIKLTLLGYKATTNKTCFSYRLHNSVSKLTNGEQYQQAFEKYVYLIAELSKSNEEVGRVVDRYGHRMLMYYCESLSHRLLKTPTDKRKTKVKEYINRCKEYAALLIPGQPFHPESIFRIRIAGTIDGNPLSSSIFRFVRKML